MKYAAAVLAAAVAVAGCRDGTADTTDVAPPPAVLGPENIAIADSATLTSGPVISGTIAPELAATVRAEVSGAVLAVPAEPGMRVGRGAVLARIEDASVRDAFLSARAAVRTAEASLDVARRNLERTQRLHAAGAVSDRDLESARLSAQGAEGAAADARARLTAASRQLERATVRAPFAGVVSEVPVSAGDVVSPGTALVSVVDPSSLRLEASVPVEQVADLAVGTPVEFTVSGYEGREFTGRISRVNPAVDPATRQVRILVTMPNDDRTLLAGLFAEGRVATESRIGVVVPQSAVDVRGVRPVVMRLRSGRVERVEVEPGTTDRVTERTEILRGLSAGDTVLVGAAQGLSEGTVARVRAD